MLNQQKTDPPTSVLTETGIPAACTGIFTLRPSHGRFTTQRCRSGLAGQEAVKSVNGPMAKTLEDITMYSKAVIDAKPWIVDPTMLPIPWQPVEPKQKLKIAVMWNDGICQPTPPVARALKETVQKLKNAGHEVVDWDPKELHLKALQLLVSDLRIMRCGRTHHCLGPNVCSRRRQKRPSTTGTYQ
jgi:amidase